MGIFDRFKKKKAEQAKPEIKEKKDEAPKYSTLKQKVEGVSVSPAKDAKETKSKKVKKEDTKDAYKILIKPLVTEKATDLGGINKYCFAVAKEANKITIKKAIMSLYGLEPHDVNIINIRGKKVISGRITGKRKNWKKAIITLKPGDKIEIYEGV